MTVQAFLIQSSVESLTYLVHGPDKRPYFGLEFAGLTSIMEIAMPEKIHTISLIAWPSGSYMPYQWTRGKTIILQFQSFVKQ